MKMFVALDLPDEVKDYMYDLQRRLKTPAVKVSWVNKKHFHLTLKFLGEVDGKKVPEIVKRLSNIKERKIKVKLSRIGFFPDEDRMRVVWLGLEPEDELNRLAQEVDAELLDLFPEEQKFSSHLTLGRVKELKKKDEFLKKVKSAGIEPLEFEFSWIKLYESVQKGAAHEYRYLKEF